MKIRPSKTGLTLDMLVKNFSRRHFEIFFILFLERQDLTLHPKETICMKCQILFSRKTQEKNLINLSSVESDHNVVSLKHPTRTSEFICCSFSLFVRRCFHISYVILCSLSRSYAVHKIVSRMYGRYGMNDSQMVGPIHYENTPIQIH